MLERKSIAQAVSRRSLTAEVRARAQDIPRGISGGQIAQRQFFSELFNFPYQYYSTMALDVHLGDWHRPIGGCSAET
jgi:hypothetical protein